MRDLSEPQQSEVGVVAPLVVLFVKKFRHGVKLLIIEDEHAVLICEYTGTITKHDATTKARTMHREDMFSICQDEIFVVCWRSMSDNGCGYSEGK